MFKPELLLPAGNIEAFHAAIEAGADAIYLGLKKFNARNRARNFLIQQLPTLIKKANEHEVKVFVTVNTVVKNNELPDLISFLHNLEQAGPYSIIVQDLGIVQIVRQYFPKLTVHASTQMNFHNSLGSKFAKRVGIKRIVLARELTQSEIRLIAKKSDVELEVFIHGALCYSVSGMCLFSSYLGGAGANRGMCAQPCRRLYSQNDTTSYLFSLKDNIQFDSLDFLSRCKIASLKVEGRMKSANYVYTVGSKYRAFLDADKRNDLKVDDNFDYTRAKTGYFLSGNAHHPFTAHPNLGEYIGDVIQLHDEKVLINSSHALKDGYRLRFTDSSRDKQVNLKLKNTEQPSNGSYWIAIPEGKSLSGLNHVYLLSEKELKFPAKFDRLVPYRAKEISYSKKQQILKEISKKTNANTSKLFLRVDSMAWLKKVFPEDFDHIILKFSKKTWTDFQIDAPFIQKYKHKFIAELPGFIFEKRLGFYRELLDKLKKHGIDKVMISNSSQLAMIPPQMKVYANESVYTFNDAAIALLKQEGVQDFVYPFENDLENLENYRKKNGIVPVYFYPNLFYARMPAKINNDVVTDDNNLKYYIKTSDNMTRVTPEVPVAFTQYKQKFDKMGYSKYLIDVSHSQPSKHLIKKVLDKFNQSEQIQPSNTFNYKRGLA